MFDDINEIHPLFKNAPSTIEFKKLRKRIIKNTREAIEQYGMIERGARWLVCLSGGKDSYTLLAALYELKWRGLLPVDILTLLKTKSLQVERTVLFVRDYAEAIFTELLAKKIVVPSCLATTEMTY